ncbi:MAG: class I SAM-dependent methyltransferase [Telluria sp.]|nr:class I SAM-dependent methyltransferase [Telluria sp.]
MSQSGLGYTYGEYAYPSADPGGAHAYLLPALLKVLGDPKHEPILDMGCGNGWVADALINRGHDVYGIDASASGIEVAQSRGKVGRFFRMDIGRDELPAELAEKRFATVISTEVIEHLYDPRAFMQLARAVLSAAPGGRLIVTTPYHGYLKDVAIAVSGKMDSHHTVLWDGGHIKFFSRRTLEQMLRQEGFNPVAFQGAGRLPYLWKSMVITAALS